MFKHLIAASAFALSFGASAAETITVYPAPGGVDSNGQIFTVEENNLVNGTLTSFLFEEEIYLGPTVGTELQNVVAGSVFANPDWKATVVNTPATVINANGKAVAGAKGSVTATWSNKSISGTYVYYPAGRSVGFLWQTLTVTSN